MTSPVEIYARVLVCGPSLTDPEDYTGPYPTLPGSPTKHGFGVADFNNVSFMKSNKIFYSRNNACTFNFPAQAVHA